MPKSKVLYRLTSEYIEFIHDKGIAVIWPDTEPVYAHDCLDRNLLASAPVQPFQSGFGQDYYPTMADKAACLFFSIAGGHIFGNGNKRTAVLAIDQFLVANSIYLALSNPDIQRLAEDTASYHERGESSSFAMDRIRAALHDNMIELRLMRTQDEKFYRAGHRMKRAIINSGGAVIVPPN